MAGSNALYIDTDKNYFEVFAGLENIFKIFRVDAIVGYKNNAVSTGVRIGAGGLLGGSISRIAGGGNNKSTNF